MILIGAAATGTNVFPTNDAADGVLAFATTQDPLPLAEGAADARLPVFSFAADGSVIRTGVASLPDYGVFEVRLYSDLHDMAAEQSIPVLLKADVRLLWSIASEANKAQLRAVTGDLVGGLHETVESIAVSETFRDKYQDRFQAILRDAIEGAIADPEVELAQSEMLEFLDRTFDKEFVGEYAGIVAKESAQAFIRLIGDSWGILSGNEERNLRERLRQVFNTPEGTALIAERLRIALTASETTDLLTTFGRALLATMLQDPRFLEAVQEVMADPAFARQFARLEQSAIQSIQGIVRLLIGVDRADRTHPLAAAILRGLLFDDARWMVAYLPPEQLGILRESAPGGVIVLVARGQ